MHNNFWKKNVKISHSGPHCGGGCAICDCIMPQVHVLKSLMHTGWFLQNTFFSLQNKKNEMLLPAQCLNIIIFSIFRSTANAIQNYSFEAKTDDLPSLADKMSLLDIGPNVTKIPIERNNGSSGLVTKIPIERVDKGKYLTLIGMRQGTFHPLVLFGSDFVS